MAKTIVLAGTLDTKGREYAFVRDLIEKAEIKTLVVDLRRYGGAALPNYYTR